MDTITQKRCSRCKEFKDVSEFWKNKRMKDGLEGQCKNCHREYWQRPDVRNRKRSYQNDWTRRKYTKEKGKRNNLKKNHGLSIEDYDGMLLEQNGRCAICKSELDQRSARGCGAHVDHNHETGKIRSLLCRDCNLLIGNAKESIETLMNAISYLQKWVTA